MNRQQRRAAERHHKLPPRVAICVPSGAMWHADMAVTFGTMMALAAPHVGLIPINQKGSYIAQNRNLITYRALFEGHADWLMWIDTDNLTPIEILLALLAHDKDIVGCDYRRRLPPFKRIANFIGDDPGVTGSGLHETDLMPQGVLLVRAEVYRKVPWPWYREIYYDPLTDADMMHADPGGLKMGEDAYFIAEARRVGYKVWCDMDLTRRVSHIGERAVGYEAGGGAYS